MSSTWTGILEQLRRYPRLDSPERARLRSEISALDVLSIDQLQSLLDALRHVTPFANPSPTNERTSTPDGGVLEAILDCILRAMIAQRAETDWQQVEGKLIDQVVELYRRVQPWHPAAYLALRGLTSVGTRTALAAVAEQLASMPPKGADDCVLVLAPLFQRPTPHIGAMLPRLLDALEHLGAAAVVLDLANFAYRRHLVPDHPARDRSRQLAGLFRGLVNQLSRLDAAGANQSQSSESQRQHIAEAMALFIALANALSLIGGDDVVDALHAGMAIRHRRLRVEVAAALARLDDSASLEALVSAAADPASRMAALACLEELGKLELVPLENRDASAVAEGQLAIWLAQPMQFGMPPTGIQEIDARRQFWPGYEQAVDCFLYRYHYAIAGRSFSGVAVVGPWIATPTVDVDTLSVDDLYALFAGWQAEHDEIREQSVQNSDDPAQDRLDPYRAQLSEEGYEHVALSLVGHFFGDQVLVATATREGVSGVLIIATGQTEWFPLPRSARPMGPLEIYRIYKGRRLLAAFNQPQPRD